MITFAYTRKSDERGDEGAAVERQEQDLRALIAREGLERLGEVRWYSDRSVSASKYSRKPRVGYQQLLADVRSPFFAGEDKQILCWHIDRLYRRPRELEDIIDMARPHRVRRIVGDRSGVLNLGEDHEITMARFGVTMAAAESSAISRRVKRQKHQRREQGKPHGSPRPFGWLAVERTDADARLAGFRERHDREPNEAERGRLTKTWDPMRHDPVEAAAIREATEAVIAGASLSEIARRWNAAGLSRPRGTAPWSATGVRVVLTSPRNAGQVAHREEGHDGALGPVQAVGDARWPAIVERSQWEAVRHVLDERATTPHARRRTLLTGLLRCGLCEGRLERHGRYWQCAKGPGRRTCGRIAVIAKPLEDHLVEEELFPYVNSDVFRARLEAEAHGDVDVDAIRRQLATLDQQLDDLVAQFRQGGSARNYRLASNALDEDRRRLNAELSATVRVSPALRYAGHPGALREAWPKLTVDQKRAIIAAVYGAIVIRPASVARGPFDPGRVDVWAEQAARRISLG